MTGDAPGPGADGADGVPGDGPAAPPGPGEPHRPGRRPPRPGRTALILGAALLLIAVAAVATVLDDTGPGRGADGTAAPSASPSPSPSGAPTVAGPRPPEIAPELRLGSEDAPVSMVVFGDYRCPYCAAFTREQQPRLVEEYVEEGRLLIVWRDYPYKGGVSERAAVAARAAGRQDAFWEYHDALYADPDAWTGSEDGDDGPFTAIAERLGLDTGRFRSDLADPELRGAVDADLGFALSLGVPGTPAFLIDGEAFFGAQPVEEFEERIEAAERAG
ncbi:DsbA family protein [Nocardiopsis composta]|uniref:Protein-disulfide isomerase n=1 Tax=Nocardiopsis composta TaxID=157465 RepID=A0A7W8QJ95_9ACTN|nr:thioredoxin domain-containing protein [Nocardiopsis composta]MBB5431254.1 protein-disulfide isomerase [Nocardiopsis composta]